MPTPRSHLLQHGRRKLPWAVALLALVALVWVGSDVLQGPPATPRIRIGAGGKDDESTVLAHALAKLVEEHADGLQVDVISGEGSIANMAALSRRELEFATVQADTPLPPEARLVGTLYNDAFLFVVRADAPMASVADLAGRKIAVASAGSAQHSSLQTVLLHYGLTTSVELVPAADPEADQMLESGYVDALFRVRSMHNTELRQLANETPIRVLPIDQAAALTLDHPWLNVTNVPRGALHGNPPVPEADATTLSVDRLLVAHSEVSDETVQEVAQHLFEHRQALLHETPVAAGITHPSPRAVSWAPLHGGVRAWLDRAKPSYLEKNADYVSLLMSTALLLGSWVWAGRAYLSRRMQKRADDHNHVLVEVLRAVDQARNHAEVAEQKRRLLRILEAVLDDVESESISPGHFQGFALGWEAAHATLRDRERELANLETES